MEACFPKQNSEKWERFPKISGNQCKGYKDKRKKQENKKLDEKVSIRNHNDWSLIIPTDILYSDIENFEGGKLKNYYEHWKSTPLTLS